ncbi:RBBP9/YdeN family alpha/beta hydrolase [Sporolactobacillus terrae]|uniref:RBBP9/YdeN family alpha/beta hydrolase n=1 Tax=Sporolactobacillus terrae TaxID=269673 RepID=UPI001CBCC286|nr:alpha/beta fold hydrolase [Sporolactobacillus terrae]UAK16979.1 alpha/beta hydrolase [Sporolactobacillus terrae]
MDLVIEVHVMNYLVLHGLGGSKGGHWQEWLTESLKRKGKKVWFPQFSDWDRPLKNVWLNQLNRTLEQIPDEPLTVVAHSLGCILWIHYAAQRLSRRIDRVIMVCPPSPYHKKAEIQDFFPLPEAKQSLAAAAKKSLFVLSTNDPFLPQADMGHFLTYCLPCFIIPEQGHINLDSGYGPWPWMLKLCLEDQMDWKNS